MGYMTTLTKIISQQRQPRDFDLSSLYPKKISKTTSHSTSWNNFCFSWTLKTTVFAHLLSYMLPSLLPQTSKRSQSGLLLLLPLWNPSSKTFKSGKTKSNFQSVFICAGTFLQLSSDIRHTTGIQNSVQQLLCCSQCTPDWGFSPVPCPHEFLALAFL